jgi:hypothetical protein
LAPHRQSKNRITAQEVPDESDARQIRSWAKAIVRSNGADQTADIICAVSIGTFVPLPRVPKRNLSSAEPTAFTTIASRIAMNRSQYQITIGSKRLHQKARLRGTSMEAVRKMTTGCLAFASVRCDQTVTSSAPNLTESSPASVVPAQKIQTASINRGYRIDGSRVLS